MMNTASSVNGCHQSSVATIHPDSSLPQVGLPREGPFQNAEAAVVVEECLCLCADLRMLLKASLKLTVIRFYSERLTLVHSTDAPSCSVTPYAAHITH
ncbi:hypothetical protein MHYP_G00066520 [Metynnis hypsauchen]